MSSPLRLTITRPDDWHVHLRDGPALAAVVAATADSFARAIVMPNLKPPVTTVAAAAAYRDRIRAALPADAAFEPLMTLYLTGQHVGERNRARSRVGFRARGQVLPGRRDHPFRRGRHLDRARLPCTRGDGA